MTAGRMRASVVVVATIALAMPAAADDVVAYQADGVAPVNASDSRTVALDDAFARAVQNALADLLPADVRTTHKAELERDIIGHARRWVAAFTVTKDDTVDGRRELWVAVQIDRDKIRDQLEQSRIPTAAPADSSAQTAIAVAVRVMHGRAAVATSSNAEAMTALFRSAGLAVRRVLARDGAGDAAPSERDAETLGENTGADWVAIANVALGEAVAVRGQAMDAILVTAQLHLFERLPHRSTRPSGTAGTGENPPASDRATDVAPKNLSSSARELGVGMAAVAAPAEDTRGGIDRALALAAMDVVPRLAAALSLSPQAVQSARASARWQDDKPLTDAGVVLVRLPAGTPYATVLAEQKFLAGAKGIRAASLRRLSPAGWVIGVVTSESIDRVSQIAAKAPTSDIQVSVKVVHDMVEVTLAGPSP